jgi:hypothetical protein
MTAQGGRILLPGITPEQGQALSQGLIFLLMGILFYRFTFGLPSRTYYRVNRTHS